MWCWKLPHAVARRTLSRGKCIDSCDHGCADWDSRQLWGVIRFLQADEILGYLAEEASSRMELFFCTTIHVRILPGRHKPYCVSNFIGTSSSILLFPKMEHLAGKRFANDEDLKDACWITRRPHGMKRVYTNWCQGTTSALMPKATMWKSRQRYLPKLVYSVTVLLLKNILVWRNIVYLWTAIVILTVMLIWNKNLNRNSITDRSGSSRALDKHGVIKKRYVLVKYHLTFSWNSALVIIMYFLQGFTVISLPLARCFHW